MPNVAFDGIKAARVWRLIANGAERTGTGQ
jgi:hypothetical protein